jgi:hypothetical protein
METIRPAAEWHIDLSFRQRGRVAFAFAVPVGKVQVLRACRRAPIMGSSHRLLYLDPSMWAYILPAEAVDPLASGRLLFSDALDSLLRPSADL